MKEYSTINFDIELLIPQSLSVISFLSESIVGENSTGLSGTRLSLVLAP